MYNFLMLFILWEPVQKPHILGGSGSRFFGAVPAPGFFQAAPAPRGLKHAAPAPQPLLMKFDLYKEIEIHLNHN